MKTLPSGQAMRLHPAPCGCRKLPCVCPDTNDNGLILRKFLSGRMNGGRAASPACQSLQASPPILSPWQSDKISKTPGSGTQGGPAGGLGVQNLCDLCTLAASPQKTMAPNVGRERDHAVFARAFGARQSSWRRYALRWLSPRRDRTPCSRENPKTAGRPRSGCSRWLSAGHP